MQTKDIVSLLKPLPAPLKNAIFKQFILRLNNDEKLKQWLISELKTISLSSKDCKLLFWCYVQERAWNIPKTFDDYRDFLCEFLCHDWLDDVYRFELTHELARHFFMRANSVGSLKYDNPLYEQAKKIAEKSKPQYSTEKQFVIDTAYYISLHHYTGSVANTLEILPQDFLNNCIDGFSVFIKKHKNSQYGINLTIVMSHLLQLWYLKRVTEECDLPIKSILLRFESLTELFDQSALRPGITCLKLHYHLFEEFDLKSAQQALSFITLHCEGYAQGANLITMASLARFTLQKYALEMINSRNAEGVRRSWLLVKSAPILCRDLINELWLRVILQTYRESTLEEAMGLMNDFIGVIERNGNSKFAKDLKSVCTRDGLSVVVSTFLEHYFKSRQECNCMHRFSAQGLKEHCRVFEEVVPVNQARDSDSNNTADDPEDAVDDADEAVAVLTSMFKAAGIDAKLYEIPSETVLRMLKKECSETTERSPQYK